MCVHWHSSKAALYYCRHSCNSGAGPSLWEVAMLQGHWGYFHAHLLIVIWAKSFCVNSPQISLEKVGRSRKSTWDLTSPARIVICTYWYSTLYIGRGPEADTVHEKVASILSLGWCQMVPWEPSVLLLCRRAYDGLRAEVPIRGTGFMS